MARALTIALVTLASGFGCGGDDVAPGDAGRDAEADAATDTALPWPGDGPPITPPTLTPCPDGWREVGGDVTTCEPYPESGYRSCPQGQAHFPGEAGCRALGASCPAGDFAEDLPTDGTVVYVLAGATAGDGSAMAPFGELREVEWARLEPGTTVALAKGTYSGVISLRPGVRLVGACAAETILSGGVDTNLAAITAFLPGEAAEVRDLTILRAPHPGIRVESGGELRVVGVAVVEADTTGVFARDVGSLLVLDDVLIAETRPNSGDLQGRGLGVQTGGRIEGHRVVLARNVDGAVFAGGAGATVELEDALILGTGSSDAPGQRGVQAQDGATFVARRSILDRNREVGIFAGREGTTVTLEDAIVRNTLPRLSDGVFGRGLNVQDGADLVLTRVVVEESHDVGVVISEAGTLGTLEDVIVRDTRPDVATASFGRGMSVQNSAVVTASRLLLERNHDAALVVTDGEATLSLEDARILDTRPRMSDDVHGYGLSAQLTAVVTARRLRVSRSVGLGIAGFFSTMTLSDVLVEDVRIADCAASSCPEENFGYGIIAISGSTDVDTFVVRDAATCGVLVAGDLGGLDLVHGVVTGSEIGACIQVDGYDFDRVADDVYYHGNRTNLESTALPVPDTIDPSL